MQRLSFACVQRQQRRNRAGIGLHIVGGVDQQTAFVDDKVAAHNAHIRLAVVGLLLPGAVHLGNAVISIHQQGEGQVVLLSELLVAFHSVRADTEDDGVLGCDLFVILAEPASLDRSASSIIFWIEIEDDFLAQIVG